MVYDGRLQFVAGDDALNLDEALKDQDVSLVLGICGRLQRRLPLLTHISLREVLYLIGVLSWVGVPSWFV